MSNNLCVIPARGGSKRIPRKNIKEFHGKPIIAYPIEVALNSGLFEEVIVSTDDEEIALIAQNYGAKIPFFRSVESSDDMATLSDVIEEVKAFYTNNGLSFDNICCILPTAPLTTIDLLKKGLNKLVKTNADSVRPVVAFEYPIQRAVRLVDGKMSMLDERYLKTRTQDLEPAYHDAGQFYWMKFETGLIGTNKYAFVISSSQAQDIDNLDDWRIAEMKYKNIR